MYKVISNFIYSFASKVLETSSSKMEVRSSGTKTYVDEQAARKRANLELKKFLLTLAGQGEKNEL